VPVESPSVLSSLKSLKNKHLAEYSDQKTRAMTHLLNDGAMKREDYASYFIKNTNG
jgi:predicted house-cleaning NTP pyrophosphatase (Maf/HAM1 superfamily)